ncbi:MAG TPA: methylmalonyl-CoA epimerase [bacterium]|nr:methylmalonyl-CoA epimerase [bacterium]
MSARLSHIGVLVHRVDAAAALYQRLGLSGAAREMFPQENIRMAFVPVEDIRIELMEPLTGTGPLARFLATRGEGIHHLAFEVPDIEQALARARSAGVRLIDETPRIGAHDTRVAFIHPSATHGVLVELVERAKDRATDESP